MINGAKIVEVIETKTDEGIFYFTLDGSPIGKFGERHMTGYEEAKEPIEKPGGVAKPLAPQMLKKVKEVEAERELGSLSNVIDKHGGSN